MVYKVALLITALVADPSVEQPKDQQDISHYLPQATELERWEAVGSPQIFVGDDLYSYINGGAVIYYEYGFRQVVVQTYAHEDGRTINLEIFEMTTPSSAYGMYTLKAGDSGEEVPVGTEALLEDYFLNFWKGNFVVTMTASDSEEETINGLVSLAQVVDAKIKQEAQKPSLVNSLPEESLQPLSITYVKGILALSNIYEFASDNIFGIKEAVIGNYDDYRIFVIKYNEKNQTIKWYENARNHFEKSSRFNNLTDYGNLFSMIDRQGKHIYIKPHQNYILIFWGTNETDSRIILEKLEKKIKSIQF